MRRGDATTRKDERDDEPFVDGHGTEVGGIGRVVGYRSADERPEGQVVIQILFQ